MTLNSVSVCVQVMSYADDIMKTAASLARLDVGTSLALLAEDKVTLPTSLAHFLPLSPLYSSSAL